MPPRSGSRQRKEDEHSIDELGRLEADRPHGRSTAACRRPSVPNRKVKKDQQAMPASAHVLVVAQEAVVGQADGDGQHGQQTNPEPQQLRRGDVA